MSKIFKLFIIVITLTSCQSAKDALTLKKRYNVDEFLVEKKSPLVLPTKFGILPSPINEKKKKEKKVQEEISILLGNNEISKKKDTKTDNNSSSIENLILEKIK